jgi:site-specific recombinase XerD
VTGTPNRLATDLLTPDEIARLIDACGDDAVGVRNQAIIATAWRSGLRVSELLALEVSDLDIETGRLVVRRGKGGKRRVAAVDALATDFLSRWLRCRKHVGIGSALLFSTLTGTPIDASYLRRLLPRLARRAGISKRCYMHGLRHAFASELEAEGAPLSAIRDLLGHANLATTDIYLRRLGSEAVLKHARDRTDIPPRTSSESQGRSLQRLRPSSSSSCSAGAHQSAPFKTLKFSYPSVRRDDV